MSLGPGGVQGADNKLGSVLHKHLWCVLHTPRKLIKNINWTHRSSYSQQNFHARLLGFTCDTTPRSCHMISIGHGFYLEWALIQYVFINPIWASEPKGAFIKKVQCKPEGNRQLMFSLIVLSLKENSIKLSLNNYHHLLTPITPRRIP